MENLPGEKRRYRRYRLENTNLIFESKSPDRIIISNGKINDISYSGIGVISNQLPQAGLIITLDFKLYPEKESIVSLAKVIWIDVINNRFGVELITPSDKFMKELMESLV